MVTSGSLISVLAKRRFYRSHVLITRTLGPALYDFTASTRVNNGLAECPPRVPWGFKSLIRDLFKSWSVPP